MPLKEEGGMFEICTNLCLCPVCVCVCVACLSRTQPPHLCRSKHTHTLGAELGVVQSLVHSLHHQRTHRHLLNSNCRSLSLSLLPGYEFAVCIVTVVPVYETPLIRFPLASTVWSVSGCSCAPAGVPVPADGEIVATVLDSIVLPRA